MFSPDYRFCFCQISTSYLSIISAFLCVSGNIDNFLLFCCIYQFFLSNTDWFSGRTSNIFFFSQNIVCLSSVKICQISTFFCSTFLKISVFFYLFCQNIDYLFFCLIWVIFSGVSPNIDFFSAKYRFSGEKYINIDTKLAFLVLFSPELLKIVLFLRF